MEDAFLSLSNAYDARKLAVKSVDDARLRAQVDVHFACYQVQQRDRAFARERYEMESQIRELTRSIEALDSVHKNSVNDSWKLIDTTRAEAHSVIRAACDEVQRVDVRIQHAQYEFDDAFEKESARMREQLESTSNGVANAGLGLEQAQATYDAAKAAHSTALDAKAALDALAKEADAFVEPGHGQQ